jgi:2-dehydropantoate 2-reductase
LQPLELDNKRVRRPAMRIAVMGSGGPGGYFGGLLSRAGEEVTFIARGAHLEALRMRGLKVKSRLAGEFTLPVRAVATPNEVGPVDLILFCVKTYDTDAAAESIRPLIGADTMLLSLQNGVDNAEHIARIAGHDSGLGAAAYVVSAIEAPGVIAQTAGPGKIILGALGGGMGARIERLQDVLQRAEISAEVHSDVRIAIWQKFLFICAFSGVTALTRMSIGPILADQATHALFRGTLEETEVVARGGGIALPEDCVEQALATAAAVEPWGRSSLYHDLAHERRLELEALNGEVVRRGHEHDIRTPLNFAIYAALKPYINGAPILPLSPSDSPPTAPRSSPQPSSAARSWLFAWRCRMSPL